MKSIDVRWVDLADLPEMSANMRRRVAVASDNNLSAPAVFDTDHEL